MLLCDLRLRGVDADMFIVVVGRGRCDVTVVATVGIVAVDGRCVVVMVVVDGRCVDVVVVVVVLVVVVVVDDDDDVVVVVVDDDDDLVAVELQVPPVVSHKLLNSVNDQFVIINGNATN
jgi:hypothetical protein